MHFESAQAVLPLTTAAPLRLTDARGTRLRAVAGTLWVTVDGDLEDRVLLAGQSLVLDSAQPVLVSALAGTASVGVCAPPVARSPWLGTLFHRSHRPTGPSGRTRPAAA